MQRATNVWRESDWCKKNPGRKTSGLTTRKNDGNRNYFLLANVPKGRVSPHLKNVPASHCSARFPSFFLQSGGEKHRQETKEKPTGKKTVLKQQNYQSKYCSKPRGWRQARLRGGGKLLLLIADTVRAFDLLGAGEKGRKGKKKERA